METKILTFTAVVFLAATTLIAIWLNHFFELESEKEEKEAIRLLLTYPSRKIGELCSNVTSECFIVSDSMKNTEKGILALRAIREKTGSTLALSDARLYVPKPMTYKTLDTRKWKVDKSFVYMKYARTMASGVFFSQAVLYNSTEESSILMMGLGGGIISGYLASRPHKTFDITIIDNEPVMKTIAQTYFHVEESEKQRIIIEDGIDFIKKASEKNKKYDAILVDACINSRAPVLCPPPSFLKDATITDFSKCLTEKGVLIVNIITPKTHKEETDKILELYKKYFTFCALVPSGSYDRMLFCFNYEHPWSKDSDLIEQHMIETDRETGFHLVDGQPYFPLNNG